MTKQKFPKYHMSGFLRHKNKVFKNETQWINFLKGLKITGERHKRIATEGALIGSIINHGFNPDLAIISDDAGQFRYFSTAYAGFM